jgi:hypothetical protein
MPATIFNNLYHNKMIRLIISCRGPKNIKDAVRDVKQMHLAPRLARNKNSFGFLHMVTVLEDIYLSIS